MLAISWTSEMMLGVPEMDNAHRRLLEQLGRLAVAPCEQFHAGYQALIGAFQRDFAEEETLMEKIKFPNRRLHREQHAHVVDGLLHIDPLVKLGDIEAGRHIVKQLPQWFLMHLSSMDLMLAVALDIVNMSHNPPPPVLLRTERARLINCLD